MQDVLPSGGSTSRRDAPRRHVSRHVLRLSSKLPASSRADQKSHQPVVRQDIVRRARSANIRDDTFTPKRVFAHLAPKLPRQRTVARLDQKSVLDSPAGNKVREPSTTISHPPYSQKVERGDVKPEMADDSLFQVTQVESSVVVPRVVAATGGAAQVDEAVADQVFSVRELEYGQQQIHLPRRFSHRLYDWRPRIRWRPRLLSLSWVGQTYGVNLLLLLLGGGLLVSLLGQLDALGRLASSIGPAQERAEEAYGKFLSAQSAIADTNFVASERDFAEAELLLVEAQNEMNRALDASGTILTAVDPTGVVRSGEELLLAGTKISKAGQHLSRGANHLLSQKAGEMLQLLSGLTTAEDEFRKALEELRVAEETIRDVNTLLLPDAIADDVGVLQESLPVVRGALEGFLEYSGLALQMLGADRDRQYLLIFQNSHEMRPTGGFVGSVGLVDIDRGAVENIAIQSVYDPDGQLREFIAPPEPLRIVNNRWYLRDANWFVDYPESAKKMAGFFEKEGGPTVDGVIAMTPDVVRDLLRVTGPLTVPEYDVVVNYDNFWEVTQDQVSYSYDRTLNKPKQFLADLTPLLLNKLFKSSTDVALPLLGSLERMAKQKHLLFYFSNEEEQAAIVELGFGGDFPGERRGLLAVNNANIGGHKSDQFIEQEIDYQLVMQESGAVDAFVTIRRTHNGPTERSDYEYPKDEDPAEKENVVWQRVLVPQGARLVSASGFTSAAAVPRRVVPDDDLPVVPDPDIVEWQQGQEHHPSGTLIGREAGATFFANWQITAPGATSVGTYHYRLPKGYATLPNLLDPADRFEAYVVKQPGDTRTRVRVSMELPESMRVLHLVPTNGVTQLSDYEVVYRGALLTDLLLGVVFEKE